MNFNFSTDPSPTSEEPTISDDNNVPGGQESRLFFSGKEKKILECDYVHMCTKLVNFKKKVVSNGRTKQESANSF